MSADDLLARLRDLSLVELDALMEGSGDERRARLLGAHIDDLADALRAARAHAKALRDAITVGPDPLAMADTSAGLRTSPRALVAGERSADKLRQRASACRVLARLDEMSATLLPRLFEAERRRHGQV